MLVILIVIKERLSVFFSFGLPFPPPLICKNVKPHYTVLRQKASDDEIP